jgi:hypothetical protein
MDVCLGVIALALFVAVVNYTLGYRGVDDGIDGG